MKILFINRDLDVKQYHLASALADVHNIECFSASILPVGYNWQAAKKQFPHPKRMVSRLIKIRAFKAGKMKKEQDLPFKSINQFNETLLDNIDPDFVYISSSVGEMINPSLLKHYPIIFDVEDSIMFRKDIITNDVLLKRLVSERTFINHKNVKIVMWGSDAERDEAINRLKPSKPFITLYPWVARRSLPKVTKQKTEYFSVVYAGSVWKGGGYRNLHDIFGRLLKIDVDLTVYLINSGNWPSFRSLKRIEKEHSNFHLKRFVPFNKLKEKISQYHVGLVSNLSGFEKTKFTFGMKPLEYAYAGVQPAALGIPLCNLSDKKEFGYCTTPELIQYNYQDNLKNFDHEYHLMDNHIEKLMDVIKI